MASLDFKCMPAILSAECSTASVCNGGEGRLKREMDGGGMGERRERMRQNAASNALNSASAVHFEYCRSAAPLPPPLH